MIRFRSASIQILQQGGVLPPFLAMIVFWTIFDGILAYSAPLLIREHMGSVSEMGLILGTSSLAGAGFDIIISKFIKRPHYRRLYLLMFACGVMVPFLLTQSSSIAMLLIAMVLWGLYFDFYSLGNFDFISRTSTTTNSPHQYGLLLTVRSIGALLAPLIAGAVISTSVNSQLFVLMWLFFALAFCSYVVLRMIGVKNNSTGADQPRTLKYELMVWRKILKKLALPATFIVLINVYDSFFYSVGPLLAETYDSLSPLNGLVVAAYWIPTLFVALYVSRFTAIWGKKRTAFITLFLAGLPLVFFAFSQDKPLATIGLIFLSSLFSSLSFPAIYAAFTDYVTEARTCEEEINAIQSLSGNLGYVIGPIFAGILVDGLGYSASFSVLGVIVVIGSLLLMLITPKHISMKGLRDL